MKSEFLKSILFCLFIVTLSLTYIYKVHNQKLEGPDLLLKVSLTPIDVIKEYMAYDNDVTFTEIDCIVDCEDDCPFLQKEEDELSLKI